MAKTETKKKEPKDDKTKQKRHIGGSILILPEDIWRTIHIELQVTSKLAASIPKTEEEIRKMLESRMPTVKPADAIPIDALTKQVAREVAPEDTEDEEQEREFGWATFKSDEHGLYFEGRAVRGHIKDCATQVAGFFPDLRGFKAKVSNRVYIATERLHLGKKKIDGTEKRFVHAMTPRGQRNSIKYIDYVEKPRLAFDLKLMKDGVINEDHLKTIFAYGAQHGIGQERSQGWGTYTLEVFEPLED